MAILDTVKEMKRLSPIVADTSNTQRNDALKEIIIALKENKDIIFEANKKDMDQATEVSDAVKKRLKFDEHKLEDVISGINGLIGLEDPLNKTLLKRELDEGLILQKVTVPIGVIGVIFEARPDALIQISTLCIKSGNCAILKGGKETQNTNQVLFDVIYKAIKPIMGDALFLSSSHSEIDELLECDGYVDLLIPRGSNSFVRYIMDHTRIPVMGHADGICHIYIDKEYDIDKVIKVVVDAKTQYTAACNAVETLLIHKDSTQLLPLIKEALEEKNVTLYGDERVQEFIDVNLTHDYHKEYLDLAISIKIADSIEEAIDHINTYGSHHTDSIISENNDSITLFTNRVDSAGVYVNASTRFADGYRYGFGAEVGISTSKLHARGPVGLDGLITYKYKLFGQGHIVDDYATHKKEFHFKDLK